MKERIRKGGKGTRGTKSSATHTEGQEQGLVYGRRFTLVGGTGMTFVIYSELTEPNLDKAVGQCQWNKLHNT